MLICYVVVRMKTDGTMKKTGKKDITKTIFLCGVLLAFAIFVVNLAVTEMGKMVSSVILFPVSSAISILMTSLVGLIVFKEKLTVKNVIGLVLGFLSIIVISVLTPENIAFDGSLFSLHKKH